MPDEHEWPTSDSDGTGSDSADDSPEREARPEAHQESGEQQAAAGEAADELEGEPGTTASIPAVDGEDTEPVERVGEPGSAAMWMAPVPDGTTDSMAPVPAPFWAHQQSAPASGTLADQPGDSGDSERSGWRGRSKALLVAGGVIGVLGLIYGADLLVTAGDVPRGVTVAGVSVGGLSEERAEERLLSELEPRMNEPVELAAGDVEAELDPQAAGLSVDWQATLEQAGQQPLNPITRVTSLFTTREVGVVGVADDDQLTTALSDLAEDEFNREKQEGDIAFEPVEGTDGDVEAVAVEPEQGQELASVREAADTVRASWLDDDGVELAVDTEPPEVTPEAVQDALETVAEPAVSAPIEFSGEGADATLRPVDIGAVLTFTPEEDGSLNPSAEDDEIEEAVAAQLAETEDEAQDAEVVFSGGEPTVEPSSDGRVIDWEPTLEPFMDVVTLTDGSDRVIDVEYQEEEPEVTTEDAEGLGIDEVIGEFTTEDFAEDSGVNIRRVAQEVDGAIVQPGETFSLNGYTGPRTEADGYVEAGIIEDGVPDRAVGGGISQFATTLYNAAYFAGMEDAGHTEHSYYIDRYPVAREATVFQAAGGGIDLAFTNDADTGVAIQTQWSPSSITVRLWGTERYDVESITSDRSDVQEPGTREVDDEDCEPSGGIAGFTATDTRVLRDADTGAEVRREEQTVNYDSTPEIICTDN